MKYVVALLAFAGIVVASMALHVHYMDPSQAPPCAVTEKFDCGAVNHSRFAVFPPRTFDEDPRGGHHIPVATVGIAGYVLIALLALTGRWWLTFQASLIGFMCAGFLSYLEAYVLEKWCIYCLWSQAIVTAIFVVTSCVVAVRWMQSRRLSAAER
ncbi:MAG: vitamin K epoxide reductase family protein [Acidobacteria bacterium]|nr:vitamin K epoxide reductase family protein [Acidobacteriota bacterium]